MGSSRHPATIMSTPVVSDNNGYIISALKNGMKTVELSNGQPSLKNGHTLNGNGQQTDGHSITTPAQKPKDPLSYDILKESADFILNNTVYRPEIAIICGSGLGGLAELVGEPDIFPYTKIPNFPVSTVSGHAGRLLLGQLNSTEVLVMQGRFHAYEGYEFWQTALPIRVMKLVGIKYLIVTNAAGGINTNFQVGDVMIINDHINLPGFAAAHPLRGPNDDRFGSRFFPANQVYSKQAIEIATKIGLELGMRSWLKSGVYSMTGGPNYETDAEVRLLRAFGIDAVGMSTIPETLVAHHTGIEVFACSLITNLCGVETNHDEVVKSAQARASELKNFISRVVCEIKRKLLDSIPPAQ